MKSKKSVIGAVVVCVLLVGWYLFRPERLVIDAKVNEGFPQVASQQASMSGDQPTALARGRFHGVAHESSGVATIHRTADGKRVLRLTEFETSNGPDLRVFLVAADDASDNETVKNAGHLELGALKGNIGDQNYDVPADADLGKYRSVTIWCNRFGVNFATAPLSMGGTAAKGAGGPTTLADGRFHSAAHETSGMATAFELADGKKVLRLADFKTSNGPDVRVYLVAAADAPDNETVKNAGFIDVAALKGNVGDQNYDLPADVDLARYRCVTVWCRRFGVNFGSAPLSMGTSASRG